MMNIRMKVLCTAAILAVLTLVVPVSADVINDFEGIAGNAIDWASDVSIDSDPNYSYDSTIGVTSGSQSVRLNQCGYAQTLSFRLDAAGKALFMANSYFSIDVSVAASGGTYTAGYTNIEEVAMNALGPGFTAVASGTPLQFYWWGSAPERTETLIVDYSDFRDAITATDYIEIILTTNPGGGAPCEIYFDNAQLFGGTGVLGAYENEVLADNPVLYLRLEEDTTTSTSSGNGPQADSSGNDYWGVHRANTEFRANEGIGNCRYLPGIDGQNAIAAGNAAEFDWTFDFSDDHAFAPDDISFELWFNADADLGAYAIFFQQVKTSEYQAPGLGNSEGTLRVYTGNPTNPIPPDPNDPNEISQFWWYTNVETPQDDQWHQVVVTYQESYGTADEMAIQLYLDGNLENSTVVGDATWPARLGPEFDHVVIGGANDLGYVWNSFKGFVDEFAIYEGILSADRIGVHYSAGLCAMSKGDLTGDCKVDMDDFSVLAATWMLCNDPNSFGTDPACGPTW